MRVRLNSVVLSLLAIAGAFALGGCENNDDEVTNGGTLVLDDDRVSGGLPMTVFIALGTETPTSVMLNAGETKIIKLAQGTYTITFDDDGLSGIGTGDTKKTAVGIQTGKTTTVEYGPGKTATTIGPSLQANG